MRTTAASVLLVVGWIAGALVTLAGVAWEILWTIDAFPDLITIFITIPMVCVTVTGIAAMVVAAPFVGIAYLLDSEALA